MSTPALAARTQNLIKGLPIQSISRNRLFWGEMAVYLVGSLPVRMAWLELYVFNTAAINPDNPMGDRVPESVRGDVVRCGNIASGGGQNSHCN